MCKSDVFNLVLDAVSRETEIDARQIVGRSRVADIVDARCIFFAMLRAEGMYASTIAQMTNRTAESVRYLLSSLEDRIAANRMVEIYLKRLLQELKKNSQITPSSKS